MRLRLTHRTFLVGILLLANIPDAVAQTDGHIDFRLENSGGASMSLPDTGKMSRAFSVAADASGFACSKESYYSVVVLMGEFDKWAGASLNPSKARFKVSVGSPGATRTTLPPQEIRLEVAWDLESRPATGAKWTYELRFDPTSLRLETDTGGACAPEVKPRFGDAAHLTVTMADLPTDAKAAADCSVAPDLPECQFGAAEVGGGSSPGPSTALLIMGACLLAGALRTRR